MLLKSLELIGFKTFPDRTRLNFHKGITAVVGPNGSGKSNISDAIRWVLGEQSFKSLRCSKMEDVVFSGTDQRKKRGFSEVTLTIDNKDRLISFDGDEIALSRRYYRNGESEYLINNGSVRLRDVHELFMDTGLGRDGYSMIGQGKIDSIVASKSEDRREMFEEAAGISRYRYKKTDAERKLQKTEENLLRIRDIVAELTDRVEPLKVQSEKAEAFIQYTKEKSGLEIALWLLNLKKLSSQLKEQENQMSVWQSRYDEHEEILSSIASDTEKIYFKNTEIAGQIDHLRRNITEHEREINEKKSSISVQKNEFLHKEEEMSRLKNEIIEIRREEELLESRLHDQDNEILQIEQQIETKKNEYSEKEQCLDGLNADADMNSAAIQNLTKCMANLNEQRSHLNGVKMAESASVEEINLRLVSLYESKTQKLVQQSDLESKLQIHSANLKAEEENINLLSKDIEAKQKLFVEKQKQRDRQKDILDKQTLDAQEKTRHVKLLEALEKNLEGFSQSVKIVMQQKSSGELPGIHDPVSRLINVPYQFNLAVEMALGSAMQNIVTSNEDDAKRAIMFLKQKDVGRLTFLPLSIIKGKMLQEPSLSSCKGYIGIASALCDCKDIYREAVNSLLGRIIVAENLNCALEIAKKYNYKYKVVTLDGQVVNAGGSMTGGSARKKSGLLSRGYEIEQSKKQMSQLLEESETAKKNYQKAVEAFTRTEKSLFDLKEAYSESVQRFSRHEVVYKACKNEIEASKESIKLLENDIESCKSRQSAHGDRILEIEKSFIQINKEICQLENQMSDVSGNRITLAEEKEKLFTMLHDCKMNILSLQKDLEAKNNDMEAIYKIKAQQKLKITSIESELKTIGEEWNNAEKVIDVLTNEIESLNTSVRRFEDQIEQLNERRGDFEKKSVELRQKEREITAEKEKVSTMLTRQAERRVIIQKQYDEIIAKLWEEYELTLRKAEEAAPEIEGMDEAQKRLADLKKKIKALGTVNLSAVEEYKEVKERYDFMSTQLADIEKSKKSLEALVIDLTKQMQNSFLENFELISRNFTEVFRELFEGGTASLELTDPQNILTSGIEILVHPPGKIVVHLEALSGGEKSLVAIAIYFAIMKVRPAPFCVMDEIEASLDDVNIDRFVRYLRKMSEQTQFILITHRRGTMEEADVLYGVTMQDEGISKMLELRTSEMVQQMSLS